VSLEVCGVLFVGDDRAEGHHDIEIMDQPHNAALRHVGNRLVGTLHGCLAIRMDL
jgi:hypothetical protein